MASVKDISVETAPTEDALGSAIFTFTDTYSVFDWGEMPDEIPDKGRSLCAMGAYNFERLEAADIPTHYRGVIPATGGDPISLASVSRAPRQMAIDYASVPSLESSAGGYDYAGYHAAAGESFVVPLEVVFRNRVPVGSSLRRRMRPADVGLDGETWPETAVDLPEPLVEFSTKFEPSDRYLDRAEAAEIAGVADIEDIEDIAREVNALVTDRAATAGFRHDDGKIEVIYHQGEIRVADVVGTFDENRFTYNGHQVSKEVLRQFYRHFHPEWVEAVTQAKAATKADPTVHWKDHCEITPHPLPATVVELAADLYRAGANAYMDRDMFAAPVLSTVIERIESELEST